MSVPQVARKIVTAIPGPKSQTLEEEHKKYVSAGVGQGMPIFAQSASGSTITDVDGNRFEIPSVEALDRASYKKIELYL